MRRRSASIGIVAGAFVVSAVIATAIAATDGSSKKASADSSGDAPVTILWIGDTTGPLKAYGNVQLAGVRGAVDYFNSRGGIDGHPVTVNAVSDNGDPAVAASVLTQRLTASTPTMVWAGSVSADASAMIPILARNDVFSIALTDGQDQCRLNASVLCPHEWILSDSSSVAPQSAVNWIKERHLTKVGLLEETTNYSAAETAQFLRAATANGISVKTASFPATVVDLTPEMQSLKEAGAQVVYAEGIGTAQYGFAARANLQWDVPLIFDPPASSLDLTKLTSAANIANAYQVSVFQQDATITLPGLSSMLQYAGKYANITALPLNVTATGWDAIVDLNDAVLQARGSLRVNDLDRAMLALPPTDPLRTLTHKLGFTKDNHENAVGSPDDYVVIPVGPLINGRVHSP
jgi:ABC-type branched-subunit amino acid transport system substrate-binding protein